MLPNANMGGVVARMAVYSARVRWNQKQRQQKELGESGDTRSSEAAHWHGSCLLVERSELLKCCLFFVQTSS